MLPIASALNASDPTVFLGLLIGGLIAISLLANQVGAFVDRFRPKPPIEQQLADFARRPEVQAIDARLSAELADQRKHISASHKLIYDRIEMEQRETRASINSLGKTIDGEFRTLYRALGKVEGVTFEDNRGG